MTATVRGISPTGRTGSHTADAREYTIVYKVMTDDRNDGPSVVMNAFGIPSIGDLYSPGNDFDNSAVVIGKTPSQGESPWEWEVEVRYSTDIGDTDLSNITSEIENPLSEPPEVVYSFQPRTILVPGQFNDPIGPPSDHGWEAGIFAPNGELFEPQPEVEIDEPVMQVTRNVALGDFVPQDIRSLANCVNSDFIDGAEPRQLKLKAPQAQRKFNKNIGFYWVVSYQIVFRWETWDIQVLNQGHYYWSSGKPTSVWSTTTLPKVKKFLSGEVRLVNLTTNGDINTTATPTFTRIRFFREINFGALGIL